MPPPLPHCQPLAWSYAADWSPVYECRKLWLKLERKRALWGRPKDREVFSTPRWHHPTRYGLAGQVLHLHWVAEWLDIPSFFDSLPKELPVVWTLHDMNPFTGGCHYAEDCGAFTNRCGHCPQLGRSHEDDLSARSFAVKQRSVPTRRLHVVTPSHWLLKQARTSRLFRAARSFRTIPYGLDTTALSPQDKQLAKRQLGLPADRVVVAFGADSFRARRKGLAYLVAALARIDKSKVYGLMFGHHDEGAPGPHLPPIQSVGYLNSDTERARLYSAADILVLPSLEDNLPQIGLEAMACGTPVVAFDTGGIPDYVRPSQTGLLAENHNAADLACKLQQLVDDRPLRLKLGQQARTVVEREFSRQQEATAYRQLFDELLATRGQRAA